MRKSDKNTISSLITLAILIFGFIYRDVFTQFIPNSIYLFVLIFVAIIIGLAIVSMIPNKKRKTQIKTKSKTIKSNAPKNKDLKYYLKADIDTMSGEDFEELCYLYFKDKGYNPRKTDRTGDHGVDLIIKDPNDGLEIVVQCKRYKSNIGNADLIKLEGGKRFYKCPGTLFITTSNFTQKAMEFAEKTHMDVWNGLVVHQRIGKWRKERLKNISKDFSNA